MNKVILNNINHKSISNKINHPIHNIIAAITLESYHIKIHMTKFSMMRMKYLIQLKQNKLMDIIYWSKF